METFEYIVVFASSSDNEVLKWVLPIVLAILTGILVPLIMRAFERSRQRNDQLENKKDQTSEKQLEKLSSTVEKLKDEHEELHRKFLTRLTNCQGNFVSNEQYKQDLKISRDFLRTIHTMLKRQEDLIRDHEDED